MIASYNQTMPPIDVRHAKPTLVCSILKRIRVMKKQGMKSPDLALENIQKLSRIFPNCVSEGKDESGNACPVVDFDLLRQELTVENLIGGGGRTIQT